jgi:hypothetical protein
MKDALQRFTVIILSLDLALNEWFYSPHKWHVVLPLTIIAAQCGILVLEKGQP